jgi:CYTH domain-containing protein
MTPLEIERVWLLTRWPDLPSDAEVWEIEQGYLSDAPGADPADFPEGRVRRIRGGGAVRCVHTTKRGAGMVREELERAIDEAEFERLWPRTAGRRIVKTRYRVGHRGHVWEVDRFRDLPIMMVEVELPSADAAADPPAWLAPCLGREVTFDPRYRNAALAIHGVPADEGRSDQ